MIDNLFHPARPLTERLQASLADCNVCFCADVERISDMAAKAEFLPDGSPAAGFVIVSPQTANANGPNNAPAAHAQALQFQSQWRITAGVAYAQDALGLEDVEKLGRLAFRVFESLHGWQNKEVPLFSFNGQGEYSAAAGYIDLELYFTCGLSIKAANNRE